MERLRGTTNQLTNQTQLDRDKASLADPQSADQVMEIGQRGAALHKALKGMKGYEEEYYKAFWVMIEAYRIVGVELRRMEKATGGGANRYGAFSEVPEGNRTKIPTLAELGISKKQSHEWQTIALVPLTEIEGYIEAKKEDSEPVTKIDIIHIAQNYKAANELSFDHSQRVLSAMSNFMIHINRLTTHLREYPDSRKSIDKELYKQLETLDRLLDEMKRSIM